MKRSAMVFAVMVAGLVCGALPVAAQNQETLQNRILEQIATGHDATSSIRQYKGDYATGSSPRVDRGAELRQLAAAEQSLLVALQALQGKSGAAQLPAAASAYQAWQAAGLLHDAHQGAIEKRLAGSDAGKAYVGKHQQVGAAQRARRQQIIDLLGPALGQPVPAALDPGALKTVLALLAPARRNTVHEPVLHALGLPVGGLGLVARAPVLAPVLVPSYAQQAETAALPADTAGAGEAPLSDEIVKQANALGGDYVRIYEFVRNNHRTAWYAGSVRGAVGTLRSGAGNDIDQASLLVALLRASGVPSRYVRGVVELGLDKVANDLGLPDPALVPAALTRAGVAFTPVARGGRVAAVNVEHVWVTALVPYTNYRGAVVDASGKTWIPLDPSFKDSTRADALVALKELGSAATLQATYLAQAHTESFGAWVTGRAIDLLQQRTGTTADPATVFGKQEIAALNLSLLPNSLPYPVVAVTFENATLAPADIVQARLTLRRADSTSTVLDLTAPLYEVGNDRLTLGWQPASLEDHRLALSFGGLDAVPLYLINLRPQLNVGGKARQLGNDGVTPGSDLALDIVLTGPFGTQSVHQTVMAGAYQAIHIGGAAATRPATKAASDTENLAASLLDGVAIAYNQSWTDGENQLAALTGVQLVRPVPAVSIVTNHMETEFLRDTPYTLAWKGVTLDAATHPVDAVGANAPSFLALTGLHGSSLESITFANQFSVGAISADRGLALAREQGIAVLALDTANASALDATDHAPAVQDSIRNLLRLGYKVDVPAQRLVQEAWSGSVWRASDAASGASGYFISGGLAGGATSTGSQVWTLDFLADALSAPNTDAYNKDPLSGVSMVKIGAGDGQTGTVGKALDKPLAVVITDKNGLPVLGAEVQFAYTLGDGLLAGETGKYTAKTDKLGIASAIVTLGKKTEVNKRYVMDEGKPGATQVSLNVIEVTALAAVGPLVIDEPFMAIARPDVLAGVKRTTPAATGGVAGIWSDSLMMLVHDQFDNPLANVNVSFAISSQQVCTSDKAAQYFKPGVVFDNSIGQDGNMTGCSAQTPTLGVCGGPSFSTLSATDGGATAGVILSNDVMGINNVHVAAAGFAQDFRYVASGFCSADSTEVSQYAVVLTSGGSIGVDGANTTATKAGTVYPPPITSASYLSTYPYEVRYRGNEAYIYWHPFPELLPATATIAYQVSDGGSTVGAAAIGKGRYQARIMTGPAPALNKVTLDASVSGPLPVIESNVLKISTGTATLTGVKAASVYGVLPTIEKIISGDTAGKFPERIVLDAAGRSVSPVQIAYQILPAAYKAGSVDVDLLEEGSVIGSVPGLLKSDKGTAWIPRGQAYDMLKKYEGRLVLNRGTPDKVEADVALLPTRQRLITFAHGGSTTLEVDHLNGRVCKIPDNIGFGFAKPVKATLTLQRLDISGTPSGAPSTLFFDRAFAAGSYTHEIEALTIGAGNFLMTLTAVSTDDPSKTDEGRDTVSSRIIEPDQLPIGQVIVNGIMVRNGSMVMQTQDMVQPGRGPALHFQPSYASMQNGGLTTMGANWTHNFDSKITINSCGDVFVSGGDGGGVRFFPDASGKNLVPAAGYHSSMRANSSDNSFDFFTKDGTRHHYRFFNSRVQWMLESITDTNGNTVALTYDMEALPSPLLTSVRTADGRGFSFAYKHVQLAGGMSADARPLIASVTGPEMAMTFDHDTFGNLVSATRSGRQEKFAYNTGDSYAWKRAQITGSTDPNGRATTYQYNSVDLSVTPPAGSPIVFPHSFVTSITTPTGEIKFDIDLVNFAKSTVTNQNGNKTTYHLNRYGSPLSIVDAAGTTNMTWSASDIVMLTKIDARGVLTSYAYDAAGNKTRETTGGKSQAWTYLASPNAPYILDRMASATDYNGNTRHNIFDNAGNLTRETLPEGIVINHGYASNGDRFQTVDGNGGQSKFTYDASGNLYTVTDPVGAVTTTLRTRRGQVKQQIDPLGNQTDFTYDDHDRVTLRVDANGGKHAWTYDAVGNKLSETDEAGVTSTWTYGKFDSPETITRAGATKTLTYDSVGNKLSETDFRGNDTTFIYDGANRLVTRTEPMGKVTGYGYDEVGNVTTETDALKRVTVHEYDALNYRTKTTDAAKGEWLMGRDGNGNKISSTDPLGRVTSYSYDGLNRLTSVTAPLGAVTASTYDKNSNKTSDTDANGNVTSQVFDAANRMTDVVRANGTKTLNTYDLADNLTKSIDPKLNTSLFSYDRLNRRKDSKDGAGYITLHEYDAVGNLSAEVQPNGNRITHGYNDLRLRTSSSDALGTLGTWDYDADGNKTLEADGNGNTSTHSYNAFGQLTASALPENRALAWEYDLMGNRTAAVDAMANRTTFTFDALNRQTGSQDALGNQHLTGYDAVGNKLTETDPLGRVTTTTYDALNRPVSVIDALQQEARFGYDLAGNKISETNKRGVKTTTDFDKLHRVTSVTKDGVRLASTSYDENGNVQSSTDANGNVTSFVYDKRNLRTQEARLLAAITNYALDAMGDITVSTDPEGRTTTNAYDLRRHVISQRNNANEETLYAYDGAGNRTTTTRPAGGVTTVAYDAANRVKSITDPAGTTAYGYDKNGNYLLVTDAERNATGHVFDVLNRRTAITYPGGASESFTYDKNSNLKTHTDGNGVVITHGYDALNRETLQSFSASADGLVSIATAYDENNNVKTVTQTGAHTLVSSFNYDNFDREEMSKDGFGATASKTYDANGNKTALITQDGKVTTYAYDTLNRLKSMLSQSGTIAYAYDRSSLNTKVTYGNGVISTMTYDAAGRARSVVHTKGAANLSRTDYDYDINGNRKTETINRTGGAQVTTYGYDRSDRLTKTAVVDAGKSVTSEYGYDAVANRTLETVTTVTGGVTKVTSKAYTYDGRNALTTIVDSVAGTTALDYDQQGNLVQKAVGNDLTTYAWNARDNLMSVARNNTVLGKYFSDYRGLRVEKEAKDPLHPDAAPVRLRTLWDGRNAFQDSTVDGVVTTRYENDGRHPVSMWSREDGVQALHRDALGSIVATTDTTGALKSETIYDAWGNVQTSTGESANKFGYTGHQMDRETGLVYFQARYYDPEIGRFITEDPYEGDYATPLSLHHYLYAYGNPTVYVDLNGYMSVGEAAERFMYNTGQSAGLVYGGAKGIAIAAKDSAVFAYDTVAIQFNNKAAIERHREASRAVAHVMVEPFKAIGEVKGWIKQTNAEADAQRAAGNPLQAGFNQVAPYAEVLAPAIASLYTHKIPGLRAPKAATPLEVPAKRSVFPARTNEKAPLPPEPDIPQSNAKLVTEGAAKELGAEPSPAALKADPSGKTYITYQFKNADGEVVYVGRASGIGTPDQVLKQRLAKGHSVYKENPELKPEVHATQGNASANKGAEGVLYEQRIHEGANLLNDPKSPPLSDKPAKAAEVRQKISDYSEDLKN